MKTTFSLEAENIRLVKYDDFRYQVVSVNLLPEEEQSCCQPYGCNNGHYPDYEVVIKDLVTGELFNDITMSCRCGRGCSNTNPLPGEGDKFPSRKWWEYADNGTTPPFVVFDGDEIIEWDDDSDDDDNEECDDAYFYIYDEEEKRAHENARKAWCENIKKATEEECDTPFRNGNDLCFIFKGAVFVRHNYFYKD